MSRAPASRIGRAPSPLRLRAIPIATVMIGSMVTAFPIITDYPILPPLGLLILLAWRFLHSDFWPVWAGAPLGLFDDIFSGQPFGSAILLWSVIMIAIELAERRFVGRDYLLDWLLAALCIAFALVGGMLLIDPSTNILRLEILLPQLLLSILVYPFIARLIAAVDHWRLSA